MFEGILQIERGGPWAPAEEHELHSRCDLGGGLSH
jgi:hypothetical protein